MLFLNLIVLPHQMRLLFRAHGDKLTKSIKQIISKLSVKHTKPIT